MSYINKKYDNHLITTKTVTVVFTTGSPVSIMSSHPLYKSICELLRNGDFNAVPAEVDYAVKIAQGTKGKFQMKDGLIVIDGEYLPDYLSNRLIEFVDNKIDTTPLERFWDNLKENPSEESKYDLYEFLDKNHYPITS